MFLVLLVALHPAPQFRSGLLQCKSFRLVCRNRDGIGRAGKRLQFLFFQSGKSALCACAAATWQNVGILFFWGGGGVKFCLCQDRLCIPGQRNIIFFCTSWLASAGQQPFLHNQSPAKQLCPLTGGDRRECAMCIVHGAMWLQFMKISAKRVFSQVGVYCYLILYCL